MMLSICPLNTFVQVALSASLVGSISAAHSSSGILPEKRRLDARAIDCVCDVNSKYNLCEVNSCGEIALDIPKTLILRKQKLHSNA